MRELFKLPYNVPEFKNIKIGDLVAAKNAKDHIFIFRVNKKYLDSGVLEGDTICCSCGKTCTTRNQVSHAMMTRWTDYYRMVHGAMAVLYGGSNVT